MGRLDLVFTREDGHAYHPEYVTLHFERLAFAAGLPPIRLHDLRHVAATLTLAAGHDLKVVQELLSHSTIVLTGDTYTPSSPKSPGRPPKASPDSSATPHRPTANRHS